MADEVEDTRPPPPEWINKEFVQKALRSGEGDQTITVVSTEVGMANPVGEGFSSDMYRVTAQLADGTTRSLIAKCQVQGGNQEDAISEAGLFAKELNMLTNTLPTMSKLLEEAKPGKYPLFTAKCLYHGDEPVTFLVLEDLKQMGFTSANRQKGLDLAHCSLVMKTLARFHAASVALHVREPALVECYAESIYAEGMREYLTGSVICAFRAVANEVVTWPDYKEKYADKLHKMPDKAYDRLIESCIRNDGGYNVLLHGDPWTSNIMFKYSDGTVTDIILVDFQTPHYSSPAIDLLYFLFACTSESVRTNHIDQLLHEYVSTLNETLEDLHCSECSISMDELQMELDKRAFFGMYAAFLVLPLVLSDPEDGFDFEKSLDANSDSLDSTKKIYSKETYKIALKRLLPLFESKGIL